MTTRSSPAPGFVRGRHYTEYVDEVRALRRSGDGQQAEELLVALVDATESEARENQWGVAPWYYEQLAICYRKRGEAAAEIAILERFARQPQPPGARPQAPSAHRPAPQGEGTSPW